jgi:hypothetical protein
MREFAMDSLRQDDPQKSPPVVETATEARQGNWGRQVLIVLIASLLLAMVAWAAVEIWGESIDDNATQSSITVPLRG